jgi:hypothetical protein
MESAGKKVVTKVVKEVVAEIAEGIREKGGAVDITTELQRG